MEATEVVKKEHWYFIYLEECVLCGRIYEYRERRYGKKPSNWQETHEYKEYACSDHFM